MSSFASVNSSWLYYIIFADKFQVDTANFFEAHDEKRSFHQMRRIYSKKRIGGEDWLETQNDPILFDRYACNIGYMRLIYAGKSRRGNENICRNKG
jgi:hypothetical protein